MSSEVSTGARASDARRTADYIAVERVGHRYWLSDRAAVTAIANVTLGVERESLVSIIGPSGCGKSTLLQIIAGLYVPSAGEVRLDGRRVDGPPFEVIYVFQQYTKSIFPWKTVQQNVAFGLENRGELDRRQIQERCAEYVRMVSLQGAEDRYPWQLSGGMQQRVAIARALACQPNVLLMDEPFSSVDALTRSELQDLLLRLWADLRLTIVFVTHDIDEAVLLGDRVAILQVGGVLAQYDRPDAILARPANDFVSRFVGADRGLKRLSLRRLSEVELDPAADGGPRLDESTTLRDAVSAMLAEGSSWVTVVRADRPIGSITLARITSLLGEDT
jgi:NitT/TauT family transport system ATP-binding protein